jgi:D-citramalate synthase
MDTTLRDGEQTSGVSFSVAEKLTIAQLLLLEVKVDRIEVASARVSDGELQAVKNITSWANENNLLDRIEVLTFVDNGASIEWMKKSGAKVMNLLTKGSLNHLKYQLKKTPEQHFEDVKNTISLALLEDIKVNVYLEDWSNGMKNSKEYVIQYLDFLTKIQGVEKILLPDTLGVLNPEETALFIREILQRYPNNHFEFHAHNDYDLATANVFCAIKEGIHGIHLTINGLGERAGNAPLASTVAVIKDFMPEISINIDERSLHTISKFIETFSGHRIPENKPVVGENVFTQTAGIHADGDKKNNLYFSKLMPERFGRKRVYALGKTSGKANIENNLKELGIHLTDDDLKKVTNHIIKLGDKKEFVTKEDLPYIIADVLDTPTEDDFIVIKSYVLTHAKNLKPSATVQIKIGKETYEENEQGDGQYDAFMKALKKIYDKKKMTFPTLTDYLVRIPPGGQSDALCETIITWKYNETELKTRGLDSDQTVSAIKATQKALNKLFDKKSLSTK